MYTTAPAAATATGSSGVVRIVPGMNASSTGLAAKCASDGATPRPNMSALLTTAKFLIPCPPGFASISLIGLQFGKLPVKILLDPFGQAQMRRHWFGRCLDCRNFPG